MESRATGDFSIIELSDNVDLYLNQDSVCSVRIEAGENLMGGIITAYSAGKLSISNENSCNWVRNMENPVKVFVSLPLLKQLLYRGYGNIVTEDTLRMHELVIDVFDGSGSLDFLIRNTTTRLNVHEGVTDVNLHGRSGVCYIYNNGIGPVDALDLSTNITFITNHSVGNSYIQVNENLEAKIDYDGDIYYRGNPDNIYLIRNGSGELIPY